MLFDLFDIVSYHILHVKDTRSCTFATLGWSSLCHTATSWRKDVRRAAISATEETPSSPNQALSLQYSEYRHKVIKQTKTRLYFPIII